jgi:hypothetical protein
METSTAAAPHPFQWRSQEAFRDAEVYGCLTVALAEGAKSSDDVRTFATKAAAVPCLPARFRAAYTSLAANCA